MMRTALVLLALLSAPTSIAAQAVRGWTVEPSSEDQFIFRFTGRTLSSAGTPTVTLRSAAMADASPSAIVAGTAVSGTDLVVRIAPDTGCGASGCRVGNTYVIRVQPTDSDGNRPTATGRVAVKWDDRGP